MQSVFEMIDDALEQGNAEGARAILRQEDAALDPAERERLWSLVREAEARQLAL